MKKKTTSLGSSKEDHEKIKVSFPLNVLTVEKYDTLHIDSLIEIEIKKKIPSSKGIGRA
jgi:hypothetical protein